MKLSDKTLSILKTFATINTNLMIKPGQQITTVAPTKDIMAEVKVDEKFEKEVRIYNMNELLGVLNAMGEGADIILEDNYLTIQEGKQKVKYVYCDASLMAAPPKAITMPAAEIEFDLSAANLAKIQKMASTLAVQDVAIQGDGKNISISVFDEKQPTGNTFDIDLQTKTKEKFNVLFKVEKLKLMPSDYKVEISSKKISRFKSDSLDLVVYIAVEATSSFE